MENFTPLSAVVGGSMIGLSAALSTGAPQAYLFFLAMAVGMVGYRLGQKTVSLRPTQGVDG